MAAIIRFGTIDCNMRWLEDYDLFLFDLDGLLVNTEWLHYEAYKTMLKERGFDIGLDFQSYFQHAQLNSTAFREYVYKTFPNLPEWDTLYDEKKRALFHLLDQVRVPLMPGVEQLIKYLEMAKKTYCVVTHSQRELVRRIREHNPVLSVIHHWIVREDYEKPKPSPDGYLKAIEKFAKPSDRIIGFEDSERGMKALTATRALPVFINDLNPETRKRFQNEGINAFTSFNELFVKDLH